MVCPEDTTVPEDIQPAREHRAGLPETRRRPAKSQCYASSVDRITSRRNPIVTAYRNAARGLDAETILLDGVHLVSEAVDAGVPLRHVAIHADALSLPEIATIIERIDARIVEVVGVSQPVMDAISPVRSSSPIVALATRPAPRHTLFQGDAPMVVIVCDVQDPGNVGAILRVAEAAGASGAIVSGQSADPFGWKALRGSMGSALRLPIGVIPRIEDACDEARTHGASVVATTPLDGVSLFDTLLAGPVALLIGGEGLGLPDSIVSAADARVTIPMEAPVESLNAAVAAAVLLYEARRQRTRRADLGGTEHQRHPAASPR